MAVDVFGRSASARDRFTDRESQAQAFANSLDALRALLAAAGELLPKEVPRRNVLAFHGIGGMGKSALSQRLERWVLGKLPSDDHWGRSPILDDVRAVRLDLKSTSGAFSVGELLLNIRDAIGRAELPLAPFDLAFAVYWDAAMGGRPLPVSNRGGHFDGAAQATVETVLEDIGLSMGVAGLGVRSVMKIAEAVRKRARLRGSLAACPELAAFLDDLPTNHSPDDAVQLAWLLGWAFDHGQPPARPTVVVFVDTYEELTYDSARRSESLLNQLVFLLPHVLWVVTGRDSVDWTEPSVRALLPYSTPSSWPGLGPGARADPRQHRVGNLSPADRMHVLREAQADDLPISDELAGAIADASEGWPLYLDLAIQVASDARAQGRTVKLSDVADSLEGLVARVLADVPADEARALHAACLTPRFDINVTAAVAEVARAAVERALQRPLVTRDGHPTFPYVLHEAVRSAIRSAHRLWNDDDWARAAERCSEALRLAHESQNDPDSRFDILIQGLHLAAENDLPYEWLIEASLDAESMFLVNRARPTRITSETGRILDEWLSCWDGDDLAERIERHRAHSDISTPIGRASLRFVAYNAPKAEAIKIMRDLVDADPSLLHRFQLGWRLSLARRFVDAERAANDLDPDDPIRARRLRSSWLWVFGQVRASIDIDSEYHEWAKTRGHYRLACEVAEGALWRRGFLETGVATEAEELVPNAERRFEKDGVRRCLLASALARAGSPAFDASVDALLEYEVAAGLAQPSWYENLARAFDAAVRGDAGRVETLTAQAAEADRSSRVWIVIETLWAIAGVVTDLDPVETQWIDGSDAVLSRWSAIVDRRRNLLQDPSGTST